MVRVLNARFPDHRSDVTTEIVGNQRAYFLAQLKRDGPAALPANNGVYFWVMSVLVQEAQLRHYRAFHRALSPEFA